MKYIKIHVWNNLNKRWKYTIFACLVSEVCLNSAFGLFSALGIYSTVDSQPQETVFDCLYPRETCKTPSKDNSESSNLQLYCILKMLVWVLEHSLIYFPPTKPLNITLGLMNCPSVLWEGSSCQPGPSFCCSIGANCPFFSVHPQRMWGVSRAAASALLIGWNLLFQTSKQPTLLCPFTTTSIILLENTTSLVQNQHYSQSTAITTGNTYKKKKICHLCLDLSFIWAIFSSLLLSWRQNKMLRRSFRNSQVDKWSYVVAPQSMRFKKPSSACYSSNCYRQQGCPVQIWIIPLEL